MTSSNVYICVMEAGKEASLRINRDKSIMREMDITKGQNY